MTARDRVVAMMKSGLRELRSDEEADARARLVAARKDERFRNAEQARSAAMIESAKAQALGLPDAEKLKTYAQKADRDYQKIVREQGLDLAVHYRCDKCRDQGFDQYGNPCSCVADEFCALLRKECGAEHIPPFRFGDDKSAELVCSQSAALAKLYRIMRKFCDDFRTARTRFILLCGQPGVGKTSLAGAVANELLDRGVSVCFLSAFDFNNALLKYHTSPLEKRAAIMEPLLESDFLVIDDLGTETVLKNVTREYLYNIIESRISHGKRTMVTTNLGAEDLMRRYGERVVSRMLNKSYSLAFILSGDDLRLRSTR